MLKISEVSNLTGLSKRTLQYYDQIGLLNASKDENNYRVYSKKDIKILQEIILSKDLNIPLHEIKKLINSSSFERIAFLKNHKKTLHKKIKSYYKMIRTIDKSIKQEEGQLSMKYEEYFEGFDDQEVQNHYEKYKEETKQKYGETEEYEESMNRTKSYTKTQWDMIKKDARDILLKFSIEMEKGPNTEEAFKCVREWQEHINKNYYQCTDSILDGLADLYVNDERFKNNLDKTKKGLAEFMSKSIKLYLKSKE